VNLILSYLEADIADLTFFPEFINLINGLVPFSYDFVDAFDSILSKFLV